jgi:hypothetical protein
MSLSDSAAVSAGIRSFSSGSHPFFDAAPFGCAGMAGECPKVEQEAIMIDCYGAER